MLGSVIQALGAPGSVYAIDAHDGRVGALDQGVRTLRPTLEIFRHNIAHTGLDSVVRMISARPADVAWDQPIGFLLIDGLHDYPNVARDFYQFEDSVLPGGYVAFHDYADYFPGVKAFVNELLAGGRYRKVEAVTKPDRAAKGPGRPRTCFVRWLAVTSLPDRSCAGREIRVVPAPGLLPHADREPPRVRAPGDRLFPAPGLSRSRAHYYGRRAGQRGGSGSGRRADPLRPPARRISIGAKHNMACELARGDVIVHWDDDDWSAPWRLTYQVEALLREPSATLCGLSRVFFYEPQSRRAWEYIYPLTGPPWLSGATFCYRKPFWESHRFPDMNEGGDTTWVWNLRDANVAPLAQHRFYVATVHPGNTSPKQTNTAGWQLRTSADIRRVLDDDGWSFYEGLSRVDGDQGSPTG